MDRLTCRYSQEVNVTRSPITAAGLRGWLGAKHGGDTKYRDSMTTGPTGSRDFANLASAQVHEVKPTKRHLPSHADRKYTYCDLCACTRQKWPKLSFKFAKKSRFTGNKSRRDG